MRCYMLTVYESGNGLGRTYNLGCSFDECTPRRQASCLLETWHGAAWVYEGNGMFRREPDAEAVLSVVVHD